MEKTTAAFIAGILSCTSMVANAEVVLVASPAFPLDHMTIAEARDAYLAMPKHLPTGATITPADETEGSPSRITFYSSVIQKSPTELKMYWGKLQFAEKGAPPVVLGDDAAVKKWVNEQSNRIGYVNGTSVDNTVKVLLRIP